MHAGKTADEIAMTHRHSDMHGAPTNLDEFLLVDDTLAVWRHLQAALANANTSASPLTITFILDNAGAELFMDLCLADYLTTIARVTHIRLHHKSFPWFVSDVVRSDVEWMLQQMEVHGAALQSTAARWRNYFATGAWSLHSHSFWTTAHAFHAMPAIAPDLFTELRASALVVVKGDLNYRKLVGDLQYPPPFTMPFDVALRYDARSGLPCDVANCNVSDMSQLPLVALRTCKADVVVGLGDPSIAERLDREVGVNCDGKGWLVTGKYAVIQATSVVHGGSERRYDSENGVE